MSAGFRGLAHAPAVVQQGTEWNLLMAGSVIVLVPLLVLFFVGQRYFIQGIVMSGLKD